MHSCPMLEVLLIRLLVGHLEQVQQDTRSAAVLRCECQQTVTALWNGALFVAQSCDRGRCQIYIMAE